MLGPMLAHVYVSDPSNMPRGQTRDLFVLKEETCYIWWSHVCARDMWHVTGILTLKIDDYFMSLSNICGWAHNWVSMWLRQAMTWDNTHQRLYHGRCVINYVYRPLLGRDRLMDISGPPKTWQSIINNLPVEGGKRACGWSACKRAP